jgi:hypothetical protein
MVKKRRKIHEPSIIPYNEIFVLIWPGTSASVLVKGLPGLEPGTGVLPAQQVFSVRPHTRRNSELTMLLIISSKVEHINYYLVN